MELEQTIQNLIRLIGDDPDREGLRDTPNRVARAYKQLFQGYAVDPNIYLKTFTERSTDEMIISDRISFVSFCEHHMLPFIGVARVGYLPHCDKIAVRDNRYRLLGLSKITRIVRHFAAKLQIQERLTQEIARFIFDAEALNPEGVGVIIEASHTCMTIRGVQDSKALMRTSCLLGKFRDPTVRQEFLSLTQ